MLTVDVRRMTVWPHRFIVLPLCVVAFLAALAMGTCGCSPGQGPSENGLVETEEADRAGVALPDDSGGADTGQQQAKPNILWILLDACRAKNLSCYGYERATSPALDGLAARGVLCEEHYVQGLSTIYSVPSYLSGQYLPTCVLDTGRWQDLTRIIPDGQRLISDVLGEHGYKTLLASTHTGYFNPRAPVWSTFDEAVGISPGEGEAYASFERLNRECLLPWLAEVGEGPFFAYVHVLDTHFPHQLEDPWDQWVDEAYVVPENLSTGMPRHAYGMEFDEGGQEYLRALYDGSILYSDDQVRVVLDALDELGLSENTIVVIASDHGENLGEDGTSWGHLNVCTDEIMHVPFIIAGPGVPGGRRVRVLTENVDIVPTLLELAGVESDAEIHGKSLSQVWASDDPAPIHDHVFARYSHEGYDTSAGFVIRGHDFKYEVYEAQSEEHLWTLPDSVGERNDVLASNAAAAARLRTVLDTEFVPLWESYVALPRKPLEFMVDSPVTVEACVSEEALTVWEGAGEPGNEIHTDNRWFIHGLKLMGTPFREHLPPITFRFAIPNGTYQAGLCLMKAEAFSNRPASSFFFSAEGEPVARYVTSVGETAAYEASGENLLECPSFEAMEEGEGLGAWRVSPGNLSASPVEDAVAVDGKRSLEIEAAPGTAIEVAQNVEATPGVMYQLVARVRSEGGGRAVRLEAQKTKDGEKARLAAIERVVAEGSSWTLLRMVFTVPEEADGTRVVLRAEGKDGEQDAAKTEETKLWVDHFQLYRMDLRPGSKRQGDELAPGKFEWVYVEAGEYTVEDEAFEVTLEAGDDGHWAYAKSVYLAPGAAGGAPVQDRQEESERTETLEALGYL